MKYVIEMNHITKQFGNFKANDDITLQIKKGEIHALLGENGAGKSTLMSILFGLYQPEAGEIRINGKTVNINSPNDANALGIGMVHQHFKLVHNFTVLENIILGRETTTFGILKMEDARKKVTKLSERYKLKINPDAYISDLTVGMQQKVEILKMLYRDNEILILDEPTAVLMPQEIKDLMNVMRQLASEGKSIIFITHKLNEIKETADRCSVLRKGKYIGTVAVKETSKEMMAEMMVGRKVNLTVEKQKNKPGEVVLEVRNLTIKSKYNEKDAVKNVSFAVRKGEILGIAGIDGNGQSELVYGITGLLPAAAGKIFLDGKEITGESVRKRYLAGMAYIPEDRHKEGLILDHTLEENLVLQSYYTDRFQKHGFLKLDAIRRYAGQLIEEADIRSGQGGRTIIRSMSGGNQQKAVIARELERNPKIVIAVQPTRGLDIGAIEYVYRRLIAQRDAGKAVLLISLELDEILGVSDRIVVMHEGEMTGEIDPKTVTAEELGLYMAGAKTRREKDEKESGIRLER